MDLKPIIKTTIENIKDINDSKEVMDAITVVVATLVKENRKELVPDFIKQFNDALKNVEQETVTIYTPINLTKHKIEILKEKVKKSFKILKAKITIEQIIDETIIGGIRIKYYDKEIDLTTNKKIKVIKKSI